MPPTIGAFGKYAAILVGGYSVLLGTLLIPYMQRFSLYAHKINTLFIHDIDNAERFGFAKNQVTPFTIPTPDGETLYIWHVLPIDLYARHEQSLLEEERSDGPLTAETFKKTLPFRLLTADTPSPARIVVNFHGNAGHIAQGWRKDTYRVLASQPNTHILSLDYRGFGKSSGSPTEEGLITDGVALVSWILETTGIPAERIVFLGQSLGTAVASAVALRFADPGNELLPPLPASSAATANTETSPHDFIALTTPTTFAGIILVAPFSSLPSLMLTYRIGGFIPILLPLRPFPWLAEQLTARIVDTWRTAERLGAYYDVLSRNPGLRRSGEREMGSLQVLHARNDLDITFMQSVMICRQVLQTEEGCVGDGRGMEVVDVREEGRPRVRFELLEFGGHNRIVTYSPVAAAVVRAFEDL